MSLLGRKEKPDFGRRHVSGFQSIDGRDRGRQGSGSEVFCHKEGVTSTCKSGMAIPSRFGARIIRKKAFPSRDRSDRAVPQEEGHQEKEGDF
jgi:hypothetical protein